MLLLFANRHCTAILSVHCRLSILDDDVACSLISLNKGGDVERGQIGDCGGAGICGRKSVNERNALAVMYGELGHADHERAESALEASRVLTFVSDNCTCDDDQRESQIKLSMQGSLNERCKVEKLLDDPREL